MHQGGFIMIMLPISAEENHRADELILSILVKSSFPMSIKEITIDTNDFYKGKKMVSSRAIRRALQILLDKKVIKQHALSSIQRFSIDTESLEKGVKLAMNFLRSNSLLKNIRSKHLLGTFSEELTFSSIDGLDHFLADFERAWTQDFRKNKQTAVFQQLLFNRASKSIRNFSPEIYKDIVYYVLCKHGNTKRKKEGSWEAKQAFIRINSKFNFKDDTLIFGDYILSITYPLQALEYLQNIYIGKKDLESPFKMEKDITLTVHKNASLAHILTEKLSQDFPCELQGMLDELKKQKELKKNFEISNKWNYVLDEQVNILTSSKFFGEIHDGDAPWMIADQEIVLMNKNIDSVKNHFVADQGLSVIDLGVGPFIKPNIILNRLNATFEDLQYLAVDFSDAVLSKAQEHAQSLFPQIKEKEFLNLDFLDLANYPDKLLSKIGYSQRLFLFIGATYGCFEVDEAMQFLKRILEPGDLFLIDIESLESPEEYLHIKSRYNEYKDEFELNHFCELGFSLSDFQISYSFNPKTWSVEGHAIIKSIPSHIIAPVKEVGLKRGDKIKFFKARKPTKEMFEKELRQIGNLELSFKKSDSKLLIAFGRML